MFIYNVKHVEQPRKHTKERYLLFKVGQILIQTINQKKSLFN